MATSNFNVDDVDYVIWNKLYDVGLVACIAHKLEELLREIIGDVLLWCPEVANWLSPDQKAWRSKANLMGCLQNPQTNIYTKRDKISAWMDGLRIELGYLINIFDMFKTAEVEKHSKADSRLRWTNKSGTWHGIIINTQKCDSWFAYVRSAETSIERLHNIQLTINHSDLLPYINSKRNIVLHHGQRRPCLQLDEAERATLKEYYSSLIKSDLLRIIDDAHGTKVSRRPLGIGNSS